MESQQTGQNVCGGREPEKFETLVTYNGVTKTLELQPQQRVLAAVEQAAHLFGITSNVHTLALFKEDGSEINVEQSVADAGIKQENLLALRPSIVRGG
jgi:formate dehydrogenase assembly factor FdhD